MIALILLTLNLLAAIVKSKSRLEAENAALRQQYSARCAVASGSVTPTACSSSDSIVGSRRSLRQC
jgi:hypothetical protein